jgi:UDP-N-acetylglucosamine--N-acetylmuramyl-(pentapeptide) pyrophosphoryl-undecaprenol N-acetylglucosamine transferase
LDPARPVLLVMGGSQGAGGINELVMQSLSAVARLAPEWQWFHLTGAAQAEKVREAYAANGARAFVHAFFGDVAMALGAATAAISRAGASSLAELAAMRVPALLVPFPAATDNHQFHNAHAFALSGAARLVEQAKATPEAVVRSLTDFMEDTVVRERTQQALVQWHAPEAARQIAEAMLAAVGIGARQGAPAAKERVRQRTAYEPALQPRSIT